MTKRDSYRYHPPELIETLLNWCHQRAAERPREVLAVGLSYGYGLNEHQIAAAVVVAAEPPATIEYALARRASKLASADRSELCLEEPDWLAAAAACLLNESNRQPAPALLYQAARRINVPLGPAYIRNLVARAGAEAAGARVSCSTLVGSRTHALRTSGLTFALQEIGHAPGWAARLARAEPVLLIPRRVS
jgi:hypothetical protein